MDNVEFELDDLIVSLVEDVDMRDWNGYEWWKVIPRRDRFRVGDIVYHVELNKFGIFIEPARKEGLVKVRLFKHKTKSDIYSRDWYFKMEDIELVKRGDKVLDDYVEIEDEFIKRAH